MRRVVSVLFIIIATAMLGAPVASAAVPSGTQVNRGKPPLTGTFEGTSAYELFVPACPVIHQTFSGTYDPDRRGVKGGTYELDVCVDQPNAEFNYPFSGTFEIVTGRGYSLRGTVTGVQTTDTFPLGLTATLIVTESPGLRHPLRGTITVVGTSDQFTGEPGTSVEAGRFTADLHR